MEKNKLKEVFLSKLLVNATKTQIIAYVGVLTALLVVCNMFFEVKFADIQFSLTIFFSVFAGILKVQNTRTSFVLRHNPLLHSSTFKISQMHFTVSGMGH